MGDLTIDGSPAEQAAIMKTSLIELWKIVRGNGVPGLQGDVMDIKLNLAEMKAMLKASIFWGKVLAGLLTLMFVGATAYFTSLEVRGKQSIISHPPQTFHSDTGESVYAKNRKLERADIPALQER